QGPDGHFGGTADIDQERPIGSEECRHFLHGEVVPGEVHGAEDDPVEPQDNDADAIEPGDRRRHGYTCAVPPSANSSAPATKLDSSDARNTATAAISRGSAT